MTSALTCGCDPDAGWTCDVHRMTQRALGELPVSPVVSPPLTACDPLTIPDPPTPRKSYPIATGVLDYFPDAIRELALVSWTGNEQHHAGEPLHWDRSKSTDEPDALLRHFLDRGTRDTDGMRHSAKVAWRALALLQKEIEADRGRS